MGTVPAAFDPLGEEQRWALPSRLGETKEFRGELIRLATLAPEHEASELLRIAEEGL